MIWLLQYLNLLKCVYLFYENSKRRVIFKKIISKKEKLYTDWMTCHGLTVRPQYIIGSVRYNLYTWEFRQQIARQAARISLKFSNLALFISSPEPTFLRISLNRDPREMMGRREICSVITNCKVNYFNIVLKSTTK